MSDSSVPWTVAFQSPLSKAFLRQEYWSGVTISFSRASSHSVDRTHISFLAGGFFTTESCFNHYLYYYLYFNFQTLFFQLQGMHILHDIFTSILSLQLRAPSSLAISTSKHYFSQLQDMHILHDFFTSILSLQLRAPSSLAIQLSPSLAIWFVILL